MDSAVNASSAEHSLIRRIDDRVNFQSSDVTLNGLDSAHDHSVSHGKTVCCRQLVIMAPV
jgi:hypothetical protein